LEDGSRWQYAYNDRNELTAGKRSWQDWSPVCGQRFEYACDHIGNRTSAASGGDVNGANLRTTTYAANALNQYTTVTTPGYKDVLGAALATNSVTVNSGSCSRKGEYFHREITVANSSAAVWQSVTVTSGSDTTNGGFAWPKNVQSHTHDSDGNLTYDGIWAYSWDAENRLAAMHMQTVDTASFPATHRQRLQFTYDHLGRRIQKIMAAFNGATSFTNYATNRFVYDGWNLIAELDHQNNVLRSYAWGQDLSGGTAPDEQNAGGVGGLLIVRDHSASATHFAGFDGNGNITTLVKTDGTLSARYEYSPFGELVRSTGPLARINPFRWSTKFTDEESGLVYYGYRYYSPTLGKWIGRDPLQEVAGLNLYGFCRNGPINIFDTDGRTDMISTVSSGGIASTVAGMVFGGISTALSSIFFQAGSPQGLDFSQVDWGEVAAWSAFGAVTGGMGGPIMGMGGAFTAGAMSASEMILANAAAGMMTGILGGILIDMILDDEGN
jgi:RHS repeat-associated protein